MDIERLKVDREYWDSVAPKDATHIDPTDHDWMKRGANGLKWYATTGTGREWSGPWTDTDILGDVSNYIPRPEPLQAEWDGKGLPPVGCECEARYDTYKAEWYRAYVIGFDGNSIIGRWREGPKEGELLDYTVNHAFRPLRTKEQREREELIGLIADRSIMTRAGEIADDIIAAGWRKTNED